MTNNSLLPCMVKKVPCKKKNKKQYKQGTTSLDSFANRSSGCHKVQCSAPYLLTTKICETPSGWRQPGQPPCITSYKRRTRLFLSFHPQLVPPSHPTAGPLLSLFSSVFTSVPCLPCQMSSDLGVEGKVWGMIEEALGVRVS